MPREACAFDPSRKLRHASKRAEAAEFFKVVYDAGEASGQGRAVVGSLREKDGWIIVEWANGLLRIPFGRIYFIARAGPREVRP